MPQEAPPLIHRLMGEVLAELPAIGKNSTAPSSMGGYKFRGIEDVLNELNAILSAKGVFFTPFCVERIESTRAAGNNKTMYCVNLLVGYTFYAPDGSSVTAQVWGEGTDMGDKSTQKAMTAAEKVMLTQVFAISTEDQARDDAERHDVPESTLTPLEQRRQAWGDKPLPNDWTTWDEMDKAMQDFQDGVKQLPVEQKDAVTAFIKEKQFPWPFSVAQLAKTLTFITEVKSGKSAAPDAPTPEASASETSDPAASEYAAT